MTTNQWPPIEQLDPLIDEISQHLVVAEQQLKTLAEIEKTGAYDTQAGNHLLDLLQANLNLEVSIIEYAHHLEFWQNQDNLTLFQKGEINFANTRLNRLAIVNLNVIRLTQNFLEHAETAETVVSGLLKRLQNSSRM